MRGSVNLSNRRPVLNLEITPVPICILPPGNNGASMGKHDCVGGFASGRAKYGKSTLAEIDEYLFLLCYHFVSQLVESYVLFCYDNVIR